MVTSLHDAIDWDHRQAINFKGQTDTEKVLIHGTSQSSLWSILGGMQVTASTASDEAVGVWTSLKVVEALGYSTLSRYGQNTWARVAICIARPDESENLFSDNPHLKGVKRGSRTRGWRSVESASSLRSLRQTRNLWSYATQGAIAPCSTTTRSLNGIRMLHVVWAMRKFFPENYMGPIGLSVEDLRLPRRKLYARIVPKSNMLEAIRGETFEITFTKGYLTEVKDEAKAVGWGALFPRELELLPRQDGNLASVFSG